MPVGRVARFLWLVCLGLSACSDRTGLLLEVQGPAAQSSLQAGIAELQLLVARPSYCERWITDPSAEVLRFSVADRDLSVDPVTILIAPDQRTDLAQPVRASVLARGADGQLLGVASFDAVPFVEGEVRRYPQHVSLLGRGAQSDGPRYLADDGCMCIPGRPSVGTSTGTGCDPLLPPSFQTLKNTAGCELPSGAELPIGVCDGQLYPGERANRESPCYVARATGCRIGQRVCNDDGGRAFDKECSAPESAAVLPSTQLCDVFAACERNACADPVRCLRQSPVVPHKALRCSVPISPDGKDGAAQPCGGGSWVTKVGTQTGAGCIASLLDGTRLGVFTVGFQQDAATVGTSSATSCPPTLRIDAINVGDPEKLPPEVRFSFTLDDAIYDVTLVPHVGCPGDAGDPARTMTCEVQ